MKIFKKLLLFWAILSFGQTAFAETQNWEIPTFNADITINQDGKINVTETIVADFTNEAHRGVARMVPYEYVDGNNNVVYTVGLNFISGTDENGNSYDIEEYKENGYLNIEMRVLDNLPTNETKTFVVKYDATNVIGFFDEEAAKEENTFPHDEFFWNVNGTEWVVPVKEVTATVHLPKSFNESDLAFRCLTGEYGMEGEDCEYKVVDGQTIEFRTTRALNTYENLSILIGMPVGTFPPPPPPEPPSPMEITVLFVIAFGGLILPIVTLIVMLILWYKFGRDDQSVPDTIMPMYEVPDKLTPTEAGVIMDENMDPRDITATIIDFAVRGYIKVNEIEEDGVLWGKNYDYELELVKPYDNVKEFEKKILHGIFDDNKAGEKKKISDLKNTFYVNLDGIQKTTMSEVVTNGYFPQDPHKVRVKYGAVGGFSIFAGFFLGGLINPSLWVGLVLSGIIIIFIGRKMPHRTTKGTETYYKLKGLHEYINTAEVDRMKFQEKNNILFEKLLPYAMAFGLIEKWSKAFEGLMKNPPNWYNPKRPWGDNGFTMIYFADRLSHISRDLSSNMASRPGSKGSGGSWSGGSGFSGGGFSGGGFGGGGGRGL